MTVSGQPLSLSVFSCSCERCSAALFVVTEFVCVLGLVGGGGGGWGGGVGGGVTGRKLCWNMITSSSKQGSRRKWIQRPYPQGITVQILKLEREI